MSTTKNNATTHRTHTHESHKAKLGRHSEQNKQTQRTELRTKRIQNKNGGQEAMENKTQKDRNT